MSRAVGWGAYQLGDGRKPVDPEPGRCRRTDGKKWRCSKEAYPDSKYCERHMHRGKSRSRKPVELSLATNPTSSQFSSSNFVAAAAAAPPPPPPPPPLSLSTPQTHHFLRPCPSSSRPPAMGFSLKDDSASFCLDSSPYTVDNYRYAWPPSIFFLSLSLGLVVKLNELSEEQEHPWIQGGCE